MQITFNTDLIAMKTTLQPLHRTLILGYLVVTHFKHQLIVH